MRIFLCLLYAAITVGLIVLLDTPLSIKGTKTPRLGYFLSPQKGFWQNAEAANTNYNADLKFDNLTGKTEVYFDDRLVPHIYAENETDAFFVEGYLHAKFRLWQMEFQAYAAGGRLSEIFGDSANGKNFLNIDIYFRRLGMGYAAENSLRAMEEDPMTKPVLDAYTAGVNAYINQLDAAEYPLEYKLLNYKPEPWTNLKTALFLKYMSYDLTGGDHDFEMTNAKTVFSKTQFEKLYPYGNDSLSTIIPRGTPFAKPGIVPKIPISADSLYFNYKDSIQLPAKPVKPNPGNGSNNWVVGGSKTQSGSPILCNDPHLGLNLPSLWYEVQLSTPGYNVYGVSFPGAPSVIIGFNDSCAWGVTNAGRDVKDYYEVTFQDSTMTHYLYNYEWKKAEIRRDTIKIKGKPDHIENIAITLWGPVMYDKNYSGRKQTNGKAYAVHWTAHNPSNELKTFMLLDRAKNVKDYKEATSNFKNPGQNFVFATKTGDIAIREAGNFPAKWRRQGDFVMPGKDSSYDMQYIPDSENVLLLNPVQGYASSANQYAYDTTYPYYMGGSDFEYFRGNIINRRLAAMQKVTPEDMQRMQTDNYNILAEMARPPLLKYLDETVLDEGEKKYLAIFKQWNLRNDGNEQGPTVFTTFWDSVKHCMYDDELSQTTLELPGIDDETMLRALRKDSTYAFADDITTPQKETLKDIITLAFKKALPGWKRADSANMLTWGKFKNSGVVHLLGIPALSRLHLFSGGGDHIINAYTQYHGPSWRMIVQLSSETEAYGLYPGGQSGNPGSKYYDTFIDKWLIGKYYPIHIFKRGAMQKQPGLLGVITFSK